jgi:hypothetical protein
MQLGRRLVPSRLHASVQRKSLSFGTGPFEYDAEGNLSGDHLQIAGGNHHHAVFLGGRRIIQKYMAHVGHKLRIFFFFFFLC